jgi:uncharacterized protein (TIGR02231 family)
MDTDVTTTITAVTVYPDRARVSCEGSVELEAGAYRLLIQELPLTLEVETVRATGRGTGRTRILSVDVRQQFYTETPATDVRQLEKAIESLEDEIRVQKDQQAGLAAQAKYLEGLRQATDHFARGLARGQTTVQDQVELVRFLQERDEAIRSQSRSLDSQLRDLNRRLEKLRLELATHHSARPRQRFQAVVEVEAAEAGRFTLGLSYVVVGAGWEPLYDLRLVEGENGQSLEVSYIAQITQKSGQDWPGVQLAVSTARPALNQRLPDLKPWFLNVYVPAPPPMQQARARTLATAAAPAPKMESFAAEPAAAVAEIAAEDALAVVQESSTAITFSVSGRSDVPSDGSPHKTTISRFRLEARLDYLSVPRHTDAVFRRIKVTNTGPAPLLAGPASLFAGDDYIGNTRLEYAPSGQEIELLFGVEERVTVKRELARREVDKALLRDKRQLRYGYKIELQNLLGREASVELHDQYPVARHEQIKVKLESATPPPAEQSELNILEWRLRLASGAKQNVMFEYLVEHPRSLEIVGLVD